MRGPMLSYPQEDLPPVHPVKYCPEAGQQSPSLHERLDPTPEDFEHMWPEVDPEGVNKEALEQVRHAISRDGVHPDHDERERPLLPALDLNQPAESGEEEEADTAAKQNPGGRPDTLHDRTNSQ